jgi:class 3 adenylate cyclase
VAELPSGTVTFLFTDVEGSTRLLDELGPERYAAELAGHRQIVRDALARAGGVEVDTQGDAFFCAFSRAADAVEAAAAQRTLATGAVPSGSGSSATTSTRRRARRGARTSRSRRRRSSGAAESCVSSWSSCARRGSSR